MNIEQRSLDAVTPYAGNPRRIPAAAVDAVAESIRRYGFRQPLVVDAEGVVIVGHTRLQAAKQLGLQTVPVHVADLTPEQAAAYRLGDNRTSELAEWDDQALAAELTALVAATSMDIAAVSEMTAFNTRELNRLLGTPPGQTDPDAVPEPTEPITTVGDLWYAVRHGRTAHWVGDRSQSTVWDIAGMNPAGGGGEEKLGHGTQKPVECMERPLRNHEGDVYEPFCGSGTTLIAAERQHRACYALEIEPRYVDMAVARWEAYTGQKAVRAS